VLQCVTAYCSWCLIQSPARVAVRCSVLPCVAMCCRVLQCIASVLQSIAIGVSFKVLHVLQFCCSVLQFVTVCCSVLQCVAVYSSSYPTQSPPHTHPPPPKPHFQSPSRYLKIGLQPWIRPQLRKFLKH